MESDEGPKRDCIVGAKAEVVDGQKEDLHRSRGGGWTHRWGRPGDWWISSREGGPSPGGLYEISCGRKSVVTDGLDTGPTYLHIRLPPGPRTPLRHVCGPFCDRGLGPF